MKPTYNLNPAYRYIMTHEITKIISQNYFMLLFSQLTKRKTILNINSETIIYNLINVSRSINHTNNIRGEYSIGKENPRGFRYICTETRVVNPDDLNACVGSL